MPYQVCREMDPQEALRRYGHIFNQGHERSRLQPFEHDIMVQDLDGRDCYPMRVHAVDNLGIAYQCHGDVCFAIASVWRRF